LTPRIIATTLLRDNVIRCTVGLFIYALLLAVAVKIREETMPNFLESLMGVLAIVGMLAFLFLIDYAARLLRPVSIVWRVAQQGLKVIEDVYPQATGDAQLSTYRREKFGPPDRTVFHRGTSAIVIAVNLEALLAAAKKADCVIEFAPRVGDFVAVDEPLFLLRGGATAINDRMLRGQVISGASAPSNRTRRLPFASLSTSRSRRCRKRSTIRPPPCSPSISFIASCAQ
jgi:uncharacterized membrane protein